MISPPKINRDHLVRDGRTDPPVVAGSQRMRRELTGVLLLDKPTGITSNHALQRVKRSYTAKRAGHTGTLDPMASGLLPIVLGEATKFGGQLLKAEKRYEAVVRLGIRTDSQDATGTVLEERPVDVSEGALRAAMARFVGRITQVPPMYSALKRSGRPLYAYAREGREVPREPRPVEIRSLVLEWFDSPYFALSVACGTGTYVRTLADDIGALLGCGAHLSALRRTGVGPFSIAEAAPLEAIERDSSGRDGLLLPPDVLVVHLPRIILTEDAVQRFAVGQEIPVGTDSSGGADGCRVYGPGNAFLGVGVVEGKGVLKPVRLMSVARSDRGDRPKILVSRG